jgi:apolipoprotein N-acyltransferase
MHRRCQACYAVGFETWTDVMERNVIKLGNIAAKGNGMSGMSRRQLSLRTGRTELDAAGVARFRRQTRIQASATARGVMTKSKIVLALCSGVCLAVAYSIPRFSWLVWIGLVPLLLTVFAENRRSTFYLSWLTGTVFFAGTIYWIAITYNVYGDEPIVFSTFRVLLLAALEGLYPAAAIVVGVSMNRRFPAASLITLPTAWVTGEWLRTWFVIGFPWGFLGNALYPELPVLQLATITGVYGLSALIVTTNVAVAKIAAANDMTTRWRIGLSLAALLFAVVGVGTLQMRQNETPPDTKSVRIGFVQGNLPQTFHFSRNSVRPAFQVYRRATESLSRLRPNFVVWPENAIGFVFQPNDLYPSGFALEREFRKKIFNLAAKLQEPLLFGAPAFVFVDGISTRNRAYLISPSGAVDDYYDKIELVPFSEYLPLSYVTGMFTDTVVRRDIPYKAGRVQRIFDVDDARFGVVICYESLFPYLTRRLANAGAGVIINISNDTWSGFSSAPAEFLGADVLRAVENHIPVVRVANSGISALISPVGRINKQSKLFTRASGIFIVNPARSPATFYAKYGDIFLYICAAMTAIWLVLCVCDSVF